LFTQKIIFVQGRFL